MINELSSNLSASVNNNKLFIDVLGLPSTVHFHLAIYLVIVYLKSYLTAGEQMCYSRPMLDCSTFTKYTSISFVKITYKDLMWKNIY